MIPNRNLIRIETMTPKLITSMNNNSPHTDNGLMIKTTVSLDCPLAMKNAMKEELTRTLQSTENSQSQSIARSKVSRFLLELYHEGFLNADGQIDKLIAEEKFQEYCKKNGFPILDNITVGDILGDKNFLFYAERKDPSSYIIFMNSFYEFRNDILNELDRNQIENGGRYMSKRKWIQNMRPKKKRETRIYPEIDTSIPESLLSFEGGHNSQIIDKFYIPTNMGCFLCQKNFVFKSDFKDHIKYHNNESNFKSLKDYPKYGNPTFRISYKICKNSPFLCFTISTNEKDIVIEKIVIITSIFNYIKNETVPFHLPSVGCDKFYVDHNMFTVGLEQPVVIVFRSKYSWFIRKFEQHHLLRHYDFPLDHVNFKSKCFLPRIELFQNRKVPKYYASDSVKNAELDEYSDEAISKISPVMSDFVQTKSFDIKNFQNVFDTLLQIEDVENAKRYDKLSQREVILRRAGRDGFAVELKNVPTDLALDFLSNCDQIILTRTNATAAALGQNSIKFYETQRKPTPSGGVGEVLDEFGKKPKFYYAFIENVSGTTVNYKFAYNDSPPFVHIVNQQKYDLVVVPSRVTLRYQYLALGLLSKYTYLQDILFPVVNLNKTLANIELELFNETIKENPEQLQGVMNIADGPKSSAPYIIFGPPGTGKTTTIVESILQLWTKAPNTRILVTAGSNAACDVVAKRLCKQLLILQPYERNILRIYSATASKYAENMDEDLLGISNLYQSHFYPSVATVRSYRIIVATLSVVGKYVFNRIGTDFFTHVFIDECAASTEPEALIAISGIMSRNTRLIIAGDTKQLGPILLSRRTVELGLDKSLMDRLLLLPMYALDENGNYDQSIQTRLVRNFRSHPDILKIANMLYYNEELKACGSAEITNRGVGWHSLPNRNFPIVFKAVFGNIAHPENSTSVYNQKELETVLDYVKDLLFFGLNGNAIKETDIGIISPYKAQYTRIQLELSKRRWNKVEVGSVELFQGKEKPIIIVSMVRSFTRTVGFLNNPKRLNVALTRAQSLLIIVGNPMTLERIKDWRKVIIYCQQNDAVDMRKSASLSTISNEMVNLSMHMKQLAVSDKEAIDENNNTNQVAVSDKGAIDENNNMQLAVSEKKAIDENNNNDFACKNLMA